MLQCFVALMTMVSTVAVQQQLKIDSVLRTWEQRLQQFQSLHLEFDAVEKDYTFDVTKHAKVVVRLMNQNGGCWVRLESFDPTGKPTTNVTIIGQSLLQYDFHRKSVSCSKLSQKFSVQEVSEMAGFVGLFPAVAFLSTRQDIEDHFRVSLAHLDEHYTWLRFSPKPKYAKYVVIGQIGVVNYANALSPGNYPLVLMWREPGNKEQKWSLTKAVINDPAEITPAQFQVDPALWKQGWTWKLSKDHGIFSLLAWLQN
jgi:hypothetical protein